jgi:hypothetical protein
VRSVIVVEWRYGGVEVWRYGDMEVWRYILAGSDEV